MTKYKNIYITGDKHGDFGAMTTRLFRYGIGSDDLLIIVGDVGLNYYGRKKDEISKKVISVLPCTILCIHGNHEMRPTSPSVSRRYNKVHWMGDTAYVEPDFPKLIFAEEGARYSINDREFLVIGGAYSVDKYYRMRMGWPWFEDEQLSGAEMKEIQRKVESHGNKEDVILAHTCPYDFRPIECFLPGLDQSKVDTTTERFIQRIIDQAEYNALYCGHWHTDKAEGKVRFLYNDIILLGA
jgi:3-oxoacid CoA-transferase subunit A